MNYLFDTSDFIPRIHCGTGWTFSLLLWSAIPTTIIVVCYLAITIRAYILFIYHDAEPENRHTFELFMLFVFVCGISRFMDILAFWWPAYRFFICINWLCALCITLLCTKSRYLLGYLLNFRILTERLSLTEQLTIQNEKYRKIKDELESTNQSLKMTVDRLQYLVESEIWLTDKRQAVVELESLLNAIKKQ